MAATSENKPKQYMSVGILAHVDAGKTTLSEGILYLTGQIRKLGRVDHGDAFLDTYTLERSRGITIFSKQANFVLGDKQVTLLDTPGHVDFSAEMERTLQVLDYAILVVSGADGVQGHTRTLWNLLARYQVPTFIFINKMDQDGTDRQDRLTELKRKLSGECVDFTEAGEEFLEELSMCDETVMESYLENGEITASQIQTLIRERKVFPCYFGSALKLEGVQELLDGLEKYMVLSYLPSTYGTSLLKNHMLRGIFEEMENNQLPEEMITAIRDTLDCNPKFQGSVVSVNQMVMLMVGCVVVFGIIFLCMTALPEKDGK